jgi:hypothetical protein
VGEGAVVDLGFRPRSPGEGDMREWGESGQFTYA